MKHSTVAKGSELTDVNTAAAPRSPVDLGKATGDLMKGIGGSLRNIGGALFGANKSSPGEPEKPKMPETIIPVIPLLGCAVLCCAVQR